MQNFMWMHLLLFQYKEKFMRRKIAKVCLLIISGLLSVVQIVVAQSADSRNCNCFVKPVSADFMLASKVVYGSIGVVLNRNDELKPKESQPVKFILPKLESKQSCGSVYRIYITDELNNTVHESEDSYNEFTYAFKDCSKTYTVKLTALSKSPAGGDGNCSRSITFRVKPQCNTASCNCAANGKTGISADLNLDGKVICLTPTDRLRRYTIQYKIVNKTNCNLRIESITVLGTSLGSSADPVTAKAMSASFNMGFSTPLATVAPADGKISASIKYSLNGIKCTAIMDLPYEPCH